MGLRFAFRRRANISIENLAEKPVTVYYQIDYAQGEVHKDAAYFHTQFRRVNPLPYRQVYTIVDSIKGKARYVGTWCTTIKPDGLYHSQQRFGLYCWHIPDPVRFESDLRVTIQALGWRMNGTYLPSPTISHPLLSGAKSNRILPFRSSGEGTIGDRLMGCR